jgi:2-keto-4-pentenoate hydratase
MPASEEQKEKIAISLYEAFDSTVPIDRPTREYDLSIADAYDIQSRFVDHRISDGATVVGHKIGLTSEGIQNQLDVDEPDYGRLLDTMYIVDGTIPMEDLIQPRIEPEIGFLMERDLTPPVTPTDVLAATRSVIPVLEIIDSRIREWDINIQDTIADNASSALYVTGDATTSIDGIDLSLEGLKIHRNGELAGSGAGAAVLNHPARAVAWLANKLEGYDQRIKAGQLVLSGSITPAVDLHPGATITAEFASLGTITIEASDR